MPEKLRAEPNLYLTLGVQSNSFMAPFVAKNSGFINFAGGFTLNPDGANGAHVKTLIHRFWPRVRVLFHGTTQYKNAELNAPPAPEVDDALQEFGLRMDMHDCVTITVHGLPPELEIRYKNSMPQEPQNRDTTYLVTCRVEVDNRDPSETKARRQAVDVIFDRLEDECPTVFRPRRLVTVHEGAVWRRLYGSTDISAWISKGRLKITDVIRPNGIIDLGSESDWAKAPLKLDCGRSDSSYFAHLLPAN
jgi:hypothetical protein